MSSSNGGARRFEARNPKIRTALIEGFGGHRKSVICDGFSSGIWYPVSTPSATPPSPEFLALNFVQDVQKSPVVDGGMSLSKFGMEGVKPISTAQRPEFHTAVSVQLEHSEAPGFLSVYF